MIARLVLVVVASLAAAPVLAGPSTGQAVERTAIEKQSKPGQDGAKTDFDYQAVRDRDEARQKAWDRKMKQLTRSICTEC
jgi:hypothetical protein